MRETNYFAWVVHGLSPYIVLLLTFLLSGGKAKSLYKTNGQVLSRQPSDQQEDDNSVKALLETYRFKSRIARLIDDRYALFPYDLASRRCAYAVLGWYYIAHAWGTHLSDPLPDCHISFAYTAECQPAANTHGSVVRYKFAFRWCEGQGEPWWLRFGSASGEVYNYSVVTLG